MPKILKEDPSVSSALANARKSLWQKQGLEPVTAGFTVNRIKFVLKSGTYTMRSVVRRKNKTGDPLETKNRILFNFRKKTKNENFEQSHSAEIHKKGDPLGFLAL